MKDKSVLNFFIKLYLLERFVHYGIPVLSVYAEPIFFPKMFFCLYFTVCIKMQAAAEAERPYNLISH